MPVTDGRRALQGLAGEARVRAFEVLLIEIAGARADAGVVGADETAHVVRVVLYSIDVPDHVTARIYDAQHVGDLAVDGQRRTLISVLRVRGRKGLDLVLAERGDAVDASRIGVEVTIRLHVL